MSRPRAPLDHRLTEQRNARTAGIDVATPLEIVDLMSAEDRAVPDAVHACRREIARAIELVESAFRGAGWNVVKVVWGVDWDALLAKDYDGLLVKRMGECVDGDYQNFAVRGRGPFGAKTE